MAFDYLIAGGGLQAGLIALALADRQPSAHVGIVERGPSLGGNHLWSFHAGDVPAGGRGLLEPLIEARWPAYLVAFPDHQRRIDEEYAAISSARLHAAVRAALARRCGEVLLSTGISEVRPGEVLLHDGRLLRARLVIDARGPEALPVQGGCGYQKFAGVELRVPRAPELPTLMDARVPQLDGYRFLYVLPLAPDRVLVEDTRYSLSPALDVAAVEGAALDWAAGNGLRGEVVRSEHGVLPLPLDRLPDDAAGQVLTAGYAGGFFHPVTGYSLPAALRLALHVASCLPEEACGPGLAELRLDLRRQQRFALLLNRLLFRATADLERWRVLSRFYRLPAETVRRFYALQSTRADRLRILCGRPPTGVSLQRALQAVWP